MWERAAFECVQRLDKVPQTTLHIVYLVLPLTYEYNFKTKVHYQLVCRRLRGGTAEI